MVSLEMPPAPHTHVPPACLCPLGLLPTLLSVVLHREMEPIGISGFKKEELFLSPSPSVISFFLVLWILHLALQPGRSPNCV